MELKVDEKNAKIALCLFACITRVPLNPESKMKPIEFINISPVLGLTRLGTHQPA